MPLDCPPGPGPPSGASLRGPTMGQIGWGGPSTGPTLLFGAAGVSPCRCEPLRAGCCGGRGRSVFRRGKLIIIILGAVDYLAPRNREGGSYKIRKLG